MNFPAMFNTMLQTIAALLIYVASYLAFAIFIIMCLVVAELIPERASVVRAYGVSPDSLDDGVSSKVQGNTRGSTGLHRQFQRQTAIHGFALYRHFHSSVSKLPDRRHIEFKAS
jgi:hypothetical protein